MELTGSTRTTILHEAKRRELDAGMKLSLVYWLVLLAVLTPLGLIGGWETWDTVGARLFMTVFSIAASWVSIQLVNPDRNDGFSAKAVRVCLVSAAVATVHYLVSYFIFTLGDRNVSPMMLAESLRSILFWVAAYLGWAALFLAQQYSAQVVERERQLSELREQAYGAQMRALRYQINPHFLFNTLNALATLIEEGEPKNAERMVLSLSAFLRSTLALDPMQDITLADELDIQARYLDVERERHSDRLTVDLDIPPGLRDALVPSLILQPLVENAVKHGVGAIEHAVRIRVWAESGGDMLSIHIDNDAPAIAPATSGTGTGLSNVAQRLETRFGESASLTCGPTGKGCFRATVTLPLRFGSS